MRTGDSGLEAPRRVVERAKRNRPTAPDWTKLPPGLTHGLRQSRTGLICASGETPPPADHTGRATATSGGVEDPEHTCAHPTPSHDHHFTDAPDPSVPRRTSLTAASCPDTPSGLDTPGAHRLGTRQPPDSPRHLAVRAFTDSCGIATVSVEVAPVGAVRRCVTQPAGGAGLGPARVPTAGPALREHRVQKPGATALPRQVMTTRPPHRFHNRPEMLHVRVSRVRPSSSLVPAKIQTAGSRARRAVDAWSESTEPVNRHLVDWDPSPRDRQPASVRTGSTAVLPHTARLTSAPLSPGP